MNRIFSLVDAIKSGDKAKMDKAFAEAVKEKVNTALDVRKVALTAQVYSNVQEDCDDKLDHSVNVLLSEAHDPKHVAKLKELHGKVRDALADHSNAKADEEDAKDHEKNKAAKLTDKTFKAHQKAKEDLKAHIKKMRSEGEIYKESTDAKLAALQKLVNSADDAFHAAQFQHQKDDTASTLKAFNLAANALKSAKSDLAEYKKSKRRSGS